MKILIDNSGYELKNSGDVSMLVVAVNRLYALFDNPEITVVTVNNEKLAELFPKAHPIGVVGRLQWNSEWNLFGGLHKLLPKFTKPILKQSEDTVKFNFYKLSKKRVCSKMRAKSKSIDRIQAYLSAIESADYVIATGGGFLTDAFSEHAYRIMTTLMLAQKLGKKTAMFGQGLGPITDKRTIKIAKKVFPHLGLIGLREGVYSANIARELGAPSSRVFVTGDDAIEMAFAKKTEQLGNAIGINMRVASYSDVNEQLLNNVQRVVHSLSEVYQAQLIPIPISGHDEDSDFKTISKIIGEDINENESNSSEKVIEQVSLCRVVVTGSYHAAVYALSQGISVVVLIGSEYYQYKFAGLANQFKSGCFFVNTFDADFDLRLDKAIKQAWNESPANREHLIAEAMTQIELSRNCYKQFFVDSR